MNNKSTKERLAIIENELLHIKETLKQIAENHLPHIYDEIAKFANFCAETKDDLKTIEATKKQLVAIAEDIAAIKSNSKSKLTGRDKAIVYGSFLTALSLIIVEIIRVL